MSLRLALLIFAEAQLFVSVVVILPRLSPRTRTAAALVSAAVGAVSIMVSQVV